jgi:pectate lyase
MTPAVPRLWAVRTVAETRASSNLEDEMMRSSTFVRYFVSGSVLCGAACGVPPDAGDDGGGGTGPMAGAAGVQATGGSGGTAPSGGTSGSAPTGGTSGTAPTGGTAGQGGGFGGVAGMGATGGAGAGGTPTGGAGAGGAGAGGAGAGGKAGAGGAGAGGAAGKGGAGAGGTAGSSGTAGAGGATGCMTPPPPSTLVGWASVNMMNQNGTTGGGNATPVVVTSTNDFNTQAAGSTARVIHVSGNLSGTFTIGSNKTVIGVCGATLRGAVRISNAVNVILRNIRVIGNNCSDSPSDCSGGADAVAITNNSHHVWVDHLDVSDGSDGNLDTNAGSDFVTISWTKFSYSSMRTDPLAGASGHRFSNLVGSGDNVPGDVGKLNVTFHHNWWAQNVNQRMPRTRYGDIHVFNNLYTSSGNSYCTNAGIQTNVLVENNVYVGVNNPLSPDANGDMLARGNLFQSTSGTTTANGMGFTPPYAYTLDATASLRATIEAQAGPR